MVEEAVHLAPGYPRGEAAMDISHVEAVPFCMAQWNVFSSKDRSRSHPPATCSLHQGEGNPGSGLEWWDKPASSAYPSLRLKWALNTPKIGESWKKKGCEDHIFTSWPLKVRVVEVSLPCGSNPEGLLNSTPVKTAAVGCIQFPKVLESLWSVLRSERWHGLLQWSPLQLVGYVITRPDFAQCDLCSHTSPGLKGPLQGASHFTRQSGNGRSFCYVWLAHFSIYKCVWMIFFFFQLYLSLGSFSNKQKVSLLCFTLLST